MFNVYYSNHLEILTNIINKIIKNNPLNNSLKSEIILVQNKDIEHWIKIKFFKKLDNLSDINFLLPNEFIHKICSYLFPNFSKDIFFNKYLIIWQLLIKISKYNKNPELSIIKEYYCKNNKYKNYKFVLKLVELFEQYMLYRPDWLDSWRKGNLLPNLGNEQYWQAFLWRSLTKDKIYLENPYWNYINIYKNLIKFLKIKKFLIPKRIFILGISSFSPFYFKILKILENYIDIHLFYLNPCMFYWEDICLNNNILDFKNKKKLFKKKNENLFSSYSLYEENNNNPLLKSWGQQGINNIKLISQISDINEINAFVKPLDNNLLHLIQSDILLLKDYTLFSKCNEKKKNKKRLLKLNDFSLRIHVCHSHQREIEVLYENIIFMMINDSTIHPKDILVMAKDINKYKPSIKAIFGNKNNKYYIPFSICDQKKRNLHPIINTFLKILKLKNSLFSIDQIIELIYVPSVSSKFNINKYDILLLKKWIKEYNVYSNLDYKMMLKFNFPIINKCNWKNRLRNIFLKYITGKLNINSDIICINRNINTYQLELVNKISKLLSILNKWHSFFIKPKKLNVWKKFITKITKDFFLPDKNTENALNMLSNLWEKILKFGLKVKYNKTISIDILEEALNSKLDEQIVNKNFLTGNINFCNFITTRSVPFKIICLLGMNEEILINFKKKIYFNLITKYPRFGDINIVHTNNYLFLEILLSAQKKLYISYIGINIKDNTKLYPSVLVQELIDYITKSFYLPDDKNNIHLNETQRVRKHLFKRYNITPFEKENFLLFYNKQNFFEKNLFKFKYKIKKKKYKIITIKKFLNFYRHPIREWFIQRLGISLYKSSHLLDNSKYYLINNFTNYQINNLILNSLLNKENINFLIKNIKKSGLLPYGGYGELYIIKQYKKMMMIYKKIKIFISNNINNYEVNIKLGNIKLCGWLNFVQNNGLLRWKPKKLTIQDCMILWIEHLIYCSIGGIGESKMFGINSEWNFLKIPIDQAKSLLYFLIYNYIKGMTIPLFLLPKTSEIWLKYCYDFKKKTVTKNKKLQKYAIHKMIQMWNGNNYFSGEKKDFYLKKIIFDLDQKNIKNVIITSEKFFLTPLRFNKI